MMCANRLSMTPQWTECSVGSVALLVNDCLYSKYLQGQGHSLIDRKNMHFLTRKNLLKGFSPDASPLHRAALSWAAGAKGGVNVASASETGKQKEMKGARKALLATLSLLPCIACQGLTVRGHDNAKSNVRVLLELRANDNPEFQWWLLRTKCKCVFRDVLCKTRDMARDVLRLLTN